MHAYLLTNYLLENADVVILVYSIDSVRSMDQLDMWNNIVSVSCPDAIKVLVGNKSDLDVER